MRTDLPSVREAQESVIEAQKELIAAMRAEITFLLEQRIRLARHMERCSDVGETTRARWEDVRVRMQLTTEERRIA